jgi:hypothetical protein
MDGNFRIWLMLHLKSRENIDHITSDVQTLFTEALISVEDFRSDISLRGKLREIIYKNHDLRTVVPTVKEKRNLPPVLERDERKFSRVIHVAEAVLYYGRFLDYTSLTLSVKFIQKVQLRTKLLEQSTVSAHIQDPWKKIGVYVTVLTVLRARQTLINARILRFLQTRRLAESGWSLYQFGLYELRPFIELSLRFTVRPMTVGRVTGMSRPKHGDTVVDLTDLNDLYRIGKNTDHVQLTYVGRGGCTTLGQVTQVRSAKTKAGHHKLVTMPIYNSLTAYIYFYMKYCSKRIEGQVTSTWVGDVPVFMSKLGKSWKSIVDDVRSYAERVNLPIDELGLNDNSYVYKSKVIWLVAQTYTHRDAYNDIDTNCLAGHAESIGISFGKENNYYSLLRELREMNVARTNIRDPVMGPNSRRKFGMELLPLPPLLRTSLSAEMKSGSSQPETEMKSGSSQPETVYEREGVSYETVHIPDGNGVDVLDKDSLFSIEYRRCMGVSKSVRAFTYARYRDVRTTASRLPTSPLQMSLRDRSDDRTHDSSSDDD